MRKFISWMLVIAMLCMSSAALALEAEADGALSILYDVDPIADYVGFQPGTELNITSSTEMAGYFATEMWGNNAADMDVRALIHGYATIAWIKTLGMALDGTPVSDIVITELNNGNRRYTFVLNKELVYNDGSPLTARDYLFSLLLSGAPQIAELGGMPRNLDHFVGYEDYRSGKSNAMKGLRLIDESSFSLEISSAYLPYFYGLAMLNITPYPIAVIAPDCDIVDDGNGAYISGEFTTELLKETLLNKDTGYVFNPRVTSGPYQLDSYDATTHTATFSVNQRYLGNFEGQKPHIEKLIFSATKNADMAGLMADGTMGITHKVVDQQAFLDLITLVQAGQIALPRNYPRSGFGYLAFACEEGPTASVAVRTAISRCIDKQEFIDSAFVAGMALPVYGYYGLGQWMTGETVEVNGEKMAMTTALGAVHAQKDIDAAKKLLIDDGWALNEQGDPFVEGTDTVRYRKSEDALEPLIIKWAKIKDNDTANAIQAAIEEPFKALGIGLEITEMLLSEMLPHYYRQTERTYNMFNLASNFTYVFDPFYDFNTDEQYQGLVNASGLKDDKLMNAAWNLRRTETRDVASYLSKWQAFQTKWIELMPMVPLYSNVYFDFIQKGVQDYNVESFSTWSLAIPYAYIADEPVLPPDAEASSDNLFVFP